MASQPEKSRLRNDVLRMRGSLSAIHRQAAESKVAQFLNELISQLKLVRLASYKNFQSEMALETWHATTPATLSFPRVDGDRLQFLRPQDLNAFEASSWGILEPKREGATVTSLQELDAVIVPGVAFDRRGSRLGYGKGYYDRALSNYLGIKIGVGFRAQLLEQDLPVESHDQQMDYIVTEDFVLSPINTEKRGTA